MEFKIQDPSAATRHYEIPSTERHHLHASDVATLYQYLVNSGNANTAKNEITLRLVLGHDPEVSVKAQRYNIPLTQQPNFYSFSHY